MEFYEAIEKRRICREFTEQDVSKDTIMKILDAGIKAPSNNHLREWEFVVIHDRKEKEKALQYVKEWVDKAIANNLTAGNGDIAKKMYAYAFPRQYSMLMDCPYLILPFFKGTPNLFQATAINMMNPLASIWCVIENIFLAATAEGLGCSMRIPVGDENEKVAAVVGAPENWILPCYIGIGYPREGIEIEQNIVCVSQKVHFEKW